MGKQVCISNYIACRKREKPFHLWTRSKYPSSTKQPLTEISPSPLALLSFQIGGSQSISISRDTHKIKLHCGDLATHRHQRAVRSFPSQPFAGRQDITGLSRKSDIIKGRETGIEPSPNEWKKEKGEEEGKFVMVYSM